MRIPKHASHAYRINPHDKTQVQVKLNTAGTQWQLHTQARNVIEAIGTLRQLIRERVGV